jgi:hypothetical protein
MKPPVLPVVCSQDAFAAMHYANSCISTTDGLFHGIVALSMTIPPPGGIFIYEKEKTPTGW